MSTSAQTIIHNSESRRSDRFFTSDEPMYTHQRIQRRTLCEAVCDGIPDSDLVILACDLEKLRELASSSCTTAASPKIEPLAEVERRHILAALRICKGNRQAAASALGIGISTIYRKLDEYAQSQKNGG